MRIVRFISIAAALALILSISAFAAPPLITSQPQNFFFPAGTELPARAEFSLMATGDDLTYQWQASINSGNSWYNLSGANAPTFSFQVSDQTVGQRLYRCIVSGSDGDVISRVVTVSVGTYLMDTIPQMLSWGSTIIDSIFVWIATACVSIIDTPLLLIGVSFFALGASIAILSRLLSRS